MEYAQEFSKREKWTRLCLYLLLGLLLVICQQKWLNPIIEDFASRPHCFELAGFNGADYLWQLILVGIPVLALIPLLFTLVPLAIKSLRQGRFPPRGHESLQSYPDCSRPKGLYKTSDISEPDSSLRDIDYLGAPTSRQHAYAR